MRRIFIASPLAPRGGNTFIDNLKLAEVLCRDAILDGVAPFAPHLLYPRFLEDTVEAERELGMKAGRRFLATCDELWAYNRLGISSGMQAEIEFAKLIEIPIIFPPRWSVIEPRIGYDDALAQLDLPIPSDKLTIG